MSKSVGKMEEKNDRRQCLRFVRWGRDLYFVFEVSHEKYELEWAGKAGWLKDMSKAIIHT